MQYYKKNEISFLLIILHAPFVPLYIAKSRGISFFFPTARQPLGGLDRLIFRGFTITLFLDTPHSVVLLWTRDQLVAETSRGIRLVRQIIITTFKIVTKFQICRLPLQIIILKNKCNSGLCSICGTLSTESGKKWRRKWGVCRKK
jgi:hypothetical protein